jgi:hypothetical protein
MAKTLTLPSGLVLIRLRNMLTALLAKQAAQVAAREEVSQLSKENAAALRQVVEALEQPVLPLATTTPQLQEKLSPVTAAGPTSATNAPANQENS